MTTAHPISSSGSTQPSGKEWLCYMARLGYAARGVVYLAVGGLAVMSALGSGRGETTGPRGALSVVGGGPFGTTLMVIMGVGLFCFAAWRFLQAYYDLDHKGTDAKGLVTRGAHVASGIIHTTLGIWVFTTLVMAGGGGADDDRGSREWTAWLLDKPGGQWLVGILGLIIVGAGVAQVIRGYTAKFEKHLSLDYDRWPWARTVCRFGLIARGIVVMMIGGLFIRAAWRHSANEAGGVAAALREIQEQPWGWVLLGIAALGLFAFGIYGLVEAWYRKINLR